MKLTTIRRRKFTDITRSLNVQVEVETYRKLESMCGRRSLGWMVEQLIIREHARRSTKLTLQLTERALISEPTVPLCN